MGLAANMSRYGMGQDRTTLQFFQFGNFDLANNVSHADQKFCGNDPLDKPGSQCLADLAARTRGQSVAKVATHRVQVTSPLVVP